MHIYIHIGCGTSEVYENRGHRSHADRRNLMNRRPDPGDMEQAVTARDLFFRC